MRALIIVALLAANTAYATDCSLSVQIQNNGGEPLLKPIKTTLWINGRYAGEFNNWQYTATGDCGQWVIGVDPHNEYGASFTKEAHVRTPNSKVFIKTKKGLPK